VVKRTIRSEAEMEVAFALPIRAPVSPNNEPRPHRRIAFARRRPFPL